MFYEFILGMTSLFIFGRPLFIFLEKIKSCSVFRRTEAIFVEDRTAKAVRPIQIYASKNHRFFAGASVRRKIPLKVPPKGGRSPRMVDACKQAS
uniref:Uncharacterized protein n=1 Tax=Rhizoctonia solani TaxID=456999 RepID=N0A6T3_9AGAM|nr:hypothetical protein RSOL_m00110 [Rhizoctonia solani]AGK45354.1 hypothetical protein RSOL_m00110 [Rhizoctonia solani]